MIPGINKLRARTLLADHDYAAPGMTDTEIGKVLGISRGRAYQLRLRAIAKIREAVANDPELRDLVSDVCGFDVAADAPPRRPRTYRRKGCARGMKVK